jgi:hypothetical protein
LTLDRAVELLRLAEADWTEALDAHIYAEPNPEFAERLRAFAEASRRQQEAFDYAANERLEWNPLPPTPERAPPYELSPDSGRVGPEPLWERFDAAYDRWDRALEGRSMIAIAEGFGAMAATAEQLALAVDGVRGVDRIPRSETG